MCETDWRNQIVDIRFFTNSTNRIWKSPICPSTIWNGPRAYMLWENVIAKESTTGCRSPRGYIKTRQCASILLLHTSCGHSFEFVQLRHLITFLKVGKIFRAEIWNSCPWSRSLHFTTDDPNPIFPPSPFSRLLQNVLWTCASPQNVHTSFTLWTSIVLRSTIRMHRLLTHTHKCVFTCNRGPPIVPLLFVL